LARLKRWKKVVLLLFVLILLSQVPFFFRRRQLANLRSAIAQLNATRHPPGSSRFTDYKGEIHVHSNLGGHSSGTLGEIVKASRESGLRFVVMTEHPVSEFNTAQQTLSGEHQGVLFISGSELVSSTGDRFLVTRKSSTSAPEGLPTNQQIISDIAKDGDLSFAAYPTEFRGWDENGFDGVEVFNLYTASHRVKPIFMALDGIWSYRSYPDLLFARFYQRPDAALGLYDKELGRFNKPLVAIGGSDAHQNVGFGLTDAAGHHPFFIQLDPYSRSFSLVSNHVLIPEGTPLNSETLLAAIKAGHCYIAFDLFANPEGFFYRIGNEKASAISGETIKFDNGLSMRVDLPLQATIKVFRGGQLVHAAENVEALDLPVTEPGIYRVEIYLPQLGSFVAAKPWIISNPIYVRNSD
jgi:hypothetical protein